MAITRIDQIAGQVTLVVPNAFIGGGGPGGATAFTALTDTPSSYAGQAGRIVKVNPGATALEFANEAAGFDPTSNQTITGDWAFGAEVDFSAATVTGLPTSATAFTDLTDTPSSLSGEGGKMVVVNSGGTALEFEAVPSGGGDLLAANNLSDLDNATTSRANLGATQLGNSLFTVTSPNAVRFLRANADNTVSTRTAAEFRGDIGAGDAVKADAENVTGIWAGANAKSLAALKARSVAGLTGGEVIQLNAGGRSGQFAWVTGNQSANVTADPQQGIWIAPDSASTGASGAWRRVTIPYVDGWVHVEWFGAVGDTVRRIDGAMTAGSATITAGGFTAARVGQPISIAGAGPGGGALDTTISAVTNFSTATLADAASTTVSGAKVVFGTPDLAAFQAAIDWLASSVGKLRGGTVKFGSKSYWIEGAIAVNSEGITLRGSLPKKGFTSGVSTLDGAILFGAALSGPVVGAWSNDVLVSEVDIDSTPGREAVVVTRVNGTPATFVYGNRQIPCGLSMETADVASGATAFLVRTVAEKVLVRNQPAEGFLVVGETAHCAINDCTAIKVKGHGLAIESGNLANRTHKKFPGLGEIRNFRAFDTGGHGIAIGHPLNNPIPYRWFITNAEVFRNCQVAGMPYIQAGTFIYGEQMVVIGSAFGGMIDTDDPAMSAGNGNEAVIPCLAVAGRDLQFLSCRYIRSAGDGHVLLKDYAAVTTRLVKFIGGYASTTTTASPIPANFLFIGPSDTSCNQVEIDGVGGDANFTNYTNITTLTGLRIVDNRASGNATSFFHNSPQNFTGSTVTITQGSVQGLTGTLNPFHTQSGTDHLTIAAAVNGNTQVSGMLRLTQSAAGTSTGDANIRASVGTNNWTFGARRSGNTWSLANNTSFSNAGNIINVLNDGGTNGFVGIGPNTTVPAHRLDIDGSINVRTGGEYRFNGQKVVGARGAAIANAAGGTEVATINAILDRLRAHGLIAT